MDCAGRLSQSTLSQSTLSQALRLLCHSTQGCYGLLWTAVDCYGGLLWTAMDCGARPDLLNVRLRFVAVFLCLGP